MKNKKSLGQNWLRNREILEEIAELAFSGNEARTCLEIGPGLGTLTASLLRRFEKVIAVEYDENLAKNLPKSFPGKNLEVINADILEFNFKEVEEPYVVVGNIPYYITSPILRKVLTVENRPKRIVLLVQKEVAERILDEKETVLSLFVKNFAKVSRGPMVGREEFTPPPKVDSEVIVLEPKEPEVDEKTLEFIRKSFRAPRKKLVHNLMGRGRTKEEIEKNLEELEIDKNVRPGDLSLGEFREVAEKMDEK